MKELFVERVIFFGENEGLFGILSAPAEAAAVDAPAIVILNTGTVHRVGHNRMYVELARTFAAHGYSALRFDFAGIGDSRPLDSGAPLLESNLAAIRAAINWLERHLNLRRFVLVGLCSGADYATMYSHTDTRVVGMSLLDPYTPRTMHYLIGYVSYRMAKPLSLLRFRPQRSFLLRVLYEALLSPVHETRDLRHISFHGRNARATLETIYAKNVAEGMQFIVLCTGSGFSPRQTYEHQFKEAFGKVDFGNQLEVHFLRDCDHLFSSPAGRKSVQDFILAWMRRVPFADRQI